MEMNNKSFILLTSTGLSYEKVFEYVADFSKNKSQTVCIVVTASEDKKNNKYVKLAIQQFNQIGIHDIHLVDIETGDTIPKNTNILYVSGGNTFKLMYYIRNSDFIESLKNIFNKNGLYIGVSAGAVVIGNSISTVYIGEADKNDIGLDNFDGLGIVNYSIFPHANKEIESEVKRTDKFLNPLFIKDKQAFLIEIQDKKIINSEFI